MLEREVRRKYLLELGGAMGLYVAVLFGSLSFGRQMPESTGRTLMFLLPMLPVALAVWALARQFARMDEYQRLRSLESLAVAALLTAGVTLTYGFLESAGFPRLSMIWIWPVMIGGWGIVACLRCLSPK